MSARDRIRAVAETLCEPRSVNWISEQADAAWSTTNEEVHDLVDHGQLRRVEAGETTRYQPDYTRLLFEETRTLIEKTPARSCGVSYQRLVGDRKSDDRKTVKDSPKRATGRRRPTRIRRDRSGSGV